ncbi:MAG: response regulator [Nitrospiraceae bacterium]
MERTRVLLVDSDEVLLEALPGTLGLWLPDAVIDTCASSRSALASLTRIDYDLIISELKLTGMDGLALLGQVKHRRPRTPFIILTGFGDAVLARQAYEAGAYDVLFKPVERHVLLRSVRQAIAMRRFSSDARHWLSGRPYPSYQHV